MQVSWHGRRSQPGTVFTEKISHASHLLLHLISETDPRKNKGIFSNGQAFLRTCRASELRFQESPVADSFSSRGAGGPITRCHQGERGGTSPSPGPAAPPAPTTRLPLRSLSLSGILAHKPALCALELLIHSFTHSFIHPFTILTAYLPMSWPSFQKLK